MRCVLVTIVRVLIVAVRDVTNYDAYRYHTIYCRAGVAQSV
jgi:hypothetical protein